MAVRRHCLNCRPGDRLAGYLFAPQLLRIYSSDPEVIRMGILRMEIICTTYFTCGLMDMLVGVLRGMGYSVVPMIVSLAGRLRPAYPVDLYRLCLAS